MIKLSFTYQDQPFRQGEVAEPWRRHPAQVSTLLTRIAKYEPMSGELVVRYSPAGPQDLQIKNLQGVTPQKLKKLFAQMGFRS
ncbi:MAG TPA: hypothetical protein DCE41_32615 [Cytophagales bacterium]|nr:hypothetical protein [Cytophagales bacterium]HAA22851.1 hypothetical protein [Cytophagales bacterium]HAP64424.1 hypothetical protein [Cytophagales bacterium]